MTHWVKGQKEREAQVHNLEVSEGLEIRPIVRQSSKAADARSRDLLEEEVLN